VYIRIVKPAPLQPAPRIETPTQLLPTIRMQGAAMYYERRVRVARTAVRSTEANEWMSVAMRLAMTVGRRNGAPDRIRTCDPWLRKPILYPTELRARREGF
jgi:hypothetical protein